MANLKEQFASRRARMTLGALAAIFVALLIFHAGVVVGSHRHFYGREGRGAWTFHAPGVGHFGLPHGFIEGGRGAVGVVQSVASSSFVLATRDGATQTVLLATTTVVSGASGVASSTALLAGERVVVLGSPDEKGALIADVIRIFPALPNTRP